MSQLKNFSFMNVVEWISVCKWINVHERILMNVN